MFPSLGSTLGSAELDAGGGQQRPEATQQLRRRAHGYCVKTESLHGPKRTRERAEVGALPDSRYKTEAPGSLKALREAGGRRVPLPSSSNKVPF